MLSFLLKRDHARYSNSNRSPNTFEIWNMMDILYCTCMSKMLFTSPMILNECQYSVSMTTRDKRRFVHKQRTPPSWTHQRCTGGRAEYVPTRGNISCCFSRTITLAHSQSHSQLRHFASGIIKLKRATNLRTNNDFTAHAIHIGQWFSQKIPNLGFRDCRARTSFSSLCVSVVTQTSRLKKMTLNMTKKMTDVLARQSPV